MNRSCLLSKKVLNALKQSYYGQKDNVCCYSEFHASTEVLIGQVLLQGKIYHPLLYLQHFYNKNIIIW